MKTCSRAWSVLAVSTAGLVLLLGMGTLCASADTITFDITQPNTALSGFPAPYVSVSITTSGGNATVTATGLTTGGFAYLMGGSSAFDLNVNASSFSVSGLPAGFSAPGPGNVDSFGNFNMRLTDTDGFGSAVQSLSFMLSTPGGFVNAGSVLTPNSLSYFAAGHIFASSSSCTGACVSGYASTPEPASLFLLGSGLLSLCGLIRLRH